MSKTTNSTSTISLNGKPKVSTTVGSNGKTSSNYMLSPSEEIAYNYSQREFANNLPNINVFSLDTLKSLNAQVNAFKANGIKQINDIYNPMLKNTQNEVATRFGNLDNSIFMDRLNSLEEKRAESVNALAQDVTAREQELMQNELANRYNYLNFLNNYQNQINQNMLGSTGQNQSLLNMGSNYANTVSQSQQNSSNQLQSQLIKALMSVYSGGSTGLPF